MDDLFATVDDVAVDVDVALPQLGYDTVASQGVSDLSFPGRVAALQRSRPIADAVSAASRQDWPEDTYDVATFALAAIDLVISQQGFEEEATYEDVVVGLVTLAERAAPERVPEEHLRVARFTVDALLNRSEREAEFAYRISDYTAAAKGHRRREVRFRLLVEREDPVRGEVVLNATRDAINALIGGLEFDVEDEQVANETMMERQLARGAFDGAERSAVRARLLSVNLAEDLATLIRDTRRDLVGVMGRWSGNVLQQLDAARDHIHARVAEEHRLVMKVRESVDAVDPDVAASMGRIAALLGECQRRHEDLHRQVMSAITVFLQEQDRQSFRPPAVAYLPDLGREVFNPVLGLKTETALQVTGLWLTDVAGPRPRPMPRLYRLLADLWSVRDTPAGGDDFTNPDEVGDPDPPVISPEVIAFAKQAVLATGLPARVSALVAGCLEGGDPNADQGFRQQAAELIALAVLWCYAPEDQDGGQSGADLASMILGSGAVAGADGTALQLPGWAGDDLMVALHSDQFETADMLPVIMLGAHGWKRT
ncbi:hypothetical protein [Tessaracoccus sp.]